MYCPYRFKYELVAWASKRWPNRNFSKMRKKQLYAIYYNC